MEDHVPRHAQMGAWVLINDRWYEGANLNAVFANQTIEPMGGAVPHKSYACQILPLDQAAEPTAKAKPEAKVNDETDRR